MFGSPKIPGNERVNLKLIWDVNEKHRRDDNTRRGNTVKNGKEKNGDGRRRTADDDGQTENSYKTPRGGGKACSLVY